MQPSALLPRQAGGTLRKKVSNLYVRGILSLGNLTINWNSDIYLQSIPGQRGEDLHGRLQVGRSGLHVEVVEAEDEVPLRLEEGGVGLEVTHEAGLPPHGQVDGLVKESVGL